MKTVALYIVANADLMAAILSEEGQGQVSLPRTRNLDPQNPPAFVLVCADRRPRGVEWVGRVQQLDEAKRVVTVSGLTPLSEPFFNLWRADGDLVSNNREFRSGDCVLCDATSFLPEMERRRDRLESYRMVTYAGRAQWVRALQAVADRLRPRHRAALTMLAQAPHLSVPYSEFMQALGTRTQGEVRAALKECGKMLARALGARHLSSFDWVPFDVTPADPDADQADHDEDDEEADVMTGQLSFPLAQAMLELGWVDHIGSPPPRKPTAAAARLSEVLVRSASQEIDQEPQAAHRNPTQREALVMARLGQGKFRQALFRIWRGQCAVTGASVARALIASHALPWEKSDDAQRLDPYNGLLLAASVDRLFDEGLIGFSDDGSLLKSPSLQDSDLQSLGVPKNARLRFVAPRHLPYLRAHREHFGFDRVEEPEARKRA